MKFIEMDYSDQQVFVRDFLIPAEEGGAGCAEMVEPLGERDNKTFGKPPVAVLRVKFNRNASCVPNTSAGNALALLDHLPAVDSQRCRDHGVFTGFFSAAMKRFTGADKTKQYNELKRRPILELEERRDAALKVIADARLQELERLGRPDPAAADFDAQAAKISAVNAKAKRCDAHSLPPPLLALRSK